MPSRHSPRWPNRQQKPPYGGVEVDWSHPLAWGLVGCWLLHNLGARDLCGQTMQSVTGSIVPSSNGLWFDAASYILVNRVGGPVVSAAPYTVVARTRPVVGTFQTIISWGEVTDNNYACTFGLYPEGSGYMAACGYNGVANNATSSGALLPSAAWSTAGVAQRASNSRTFLLDGRCETNTVDFPNGGAGGGLCIGEGFRNSSPLGGCYFYGEISWIFAWNRGLTDAELLKVYASPYCFLKERTRRTYGFLGTIKKARVWGQSSVAADETPLSWTDFLTDVGDPITVQGDADYGKAQIDDGVLILSSVVDTGDATAKTITVSRDLYGTGSGTVKVSIRGSATPFARTA